MPKARDSSDLARCAGALLFLKFLPRRDSKESDFFVTPLATVACAMQPVQSFQWARVAVEADVPEGADSFVLGLAISGNGTAWFGDLEFATTERAASGDGAPPHAY
jgi:hypothetical protein